MVTIRERPAFVAPCGTFSVTRDICRHQEPPIQSENHDLRRRALARPTTLDLLVEGSIPSGLTTSRHSSRRGSPGGISEAASAFGLALSWSIPSGLTIRPPFARLVASQRLAHGKSGRMS